MGDEPLDIFLQHASAGARSGDLRSAEPEIVHQTLGRWHDDRIARVSGSRWWGSWRVGRRRRCRWRRFGFRRRLCGNGLSVCGRFDRRDRFAYHRELFGFLQQIPQVTAGGRRDLDRSLFGLDFDDIFAFVNPITLTLQPLADLDFGNRFTDIGNRDFDHDFALETECYVDDFVDR